MYTMANSQIPKLPLINTIRIYFKFFSYSTQILFQVSRHWTLNFQTIFFSSQTPHMYMYFVSSFWTWTLIFQTCATVIITSSIITQLQLQVVVNPSENEDILPVHPGQQNALLFIQLTLEQPSQSQSVKQLPLIDDPEEVPEEQKNIQK